MKKLLTFAGVSALALITAAPDAFGAYGIYNPSCGSNNVTVKFWGFNADGDFEALQTLTFNAGAWKNGSSPITKLSESLFKDVSDVKVNNTTYKKLIPIQFTSTDGEPSVAPVNISTTCAADTTAGRYAIGGNLPSEITGLENRTQWNYVVVYAADCEPGANATCTLTTDKSVGKATYANACTEGSSDPNWSLTTVLSCEIGEMVETDNPDAPAVS